jgi:hypothetical protein
MALGPPNSGRSIFGAKVGSPLLAGKQSPGARPPDFRDRIGCMIRVDITPAAYAAIAAN